MPQTPRAPDLEDVTVTARDDSRAGFAVLPTAMVSRLHEGSEETGWARRASWGECHGAGPDGRPVPQSGEPSGGLSLRMTSNGPSAVQRVRGTLGLGILPVSQEDHTLGGVSPHPPDFRHQCSPQFPECSHGEGWPGSREKFSRDLALSTLNTESEAWLSHHSMGFPGLRREGRASASDPTGMVAQPDPGVLLSGLSGLTKRCGVGAMAQVSGSRFCSQPGWSAREAADTLSHSSSFPDFRVSPGSVEPGRDSGLISGLVLTIKENGAECLENRHRLPLKTERFTPPVLPAPVPLSLLRLSLLAPGPSQEVGRERSTQAPCSTRPCPVVTAFLALLSLACSQG